MCAVNSSSDRPDENFRHGPTRSAHSVGRVGALAVALGIGGAILGFSPVAAADTGDAAGAGQDTGRSADSADSSQRRGRAAASSGTAEAPTTNSRSGRATRPGRGSGAVESDPVVEPAQTRKAGTPAPAATVTQAPAAAVDPAPALAPEPEPATIEDLAPVAVRPAVADAGPDVPGSAVSGDAVVAPVEIAAVAEEAPVMTAAAPDVVSEGEIDPTALLGEDGTGEPGAEPLAWAALAVTRREDLAGAKPEVAPAAVEGTAETVDPVVGARDITITGFSSNSAQAGTQITIYGTSFNGGTGVPAVNTVYFGRRDSNTDWQAGNRLASGHCSGGRYDRFSSGIRSRLRYWEAFVVGLQLDFHCGSILPRADNNLIEFKLRCGGHFGHNHRH